MDFSIFDKLLQSQPPGQNTVLAPMASNQDVPDAPPPPPAEIPPRMAVVPPSQRTAPVQSIAPMGPPSPTDDMEGPIAPTPKAIESAPSDAPDFAKMFADQDAMTKKKNLNTILGDLGDNLSSGQSWGNFFTGKMNPTSTSGASTAQALNNNMIDPMARMKSQQDLLAQYRQGKVQGQQSSDLDESMKMDSMPTKLSQSLALSAVGALKNNPQFKQNPEALAQLEDTIKTSNAHQIHDLMEKNPMLKEMFTSTTAGQKLDAQMAALNARMDMANKNYDLRSKNQGDRLSRSFNNDYSHELGPIESTLQGANRVLQIGSKIKAGDLKSTGQLRSDLSAALASMMNNGKPATVYGMSHQDFDSLWGRAQSALGMLTGQTPNTMTDAQLSQLMKDVTALKGEYLVQHKNKFDAWKEGVPEDYVAPLENRFNKFRSTGAEQESGPKGKAKTVIQNGHTYTLNEKTGEYE